MPKCFQPVLLTSPTWPWEILSISSERFANHFTIAPFTWVFQTAHKWESALTHMWYLRYLWYLSHACGEKILPCGEISEWAQKLIVLVGKLSLCWWKIVHFGGNIVHSVWKTNWANVFVGGEKGDKYHACLNIILSTTLDGVGFQISEDGGSPFA